MRQKAIVLILAAGSVLLTARSCVANDEAASPEALISRARLQEDLWTEGTPSLFMQAELRVSDSKGSTVQGSYTFHWNSASRWREEIKFSNYDLLRVGEAKGYWQISSLNYRPQVIFQLDTLLHLKDTLRIGPKQSLGKVKHREKAGIRQMCTEVKWARATDRVMCFDEAKGTLLSVEYLRPEHQNSPDISRIEYTAFSSVSGKLVPHEIKALKEGSVVVAVKILGITNGTEEDSAPFTVPANAEFWPQCPDMQEAEVVERLQPQYPATARSNREQGRVTFYGIVEADGSLSHLTVIQRATPDLEAAALEAARHRRYKPAACGQTPIRVEISISTDFWLEF